MNANASQAAMILEYLQAGHRITPAEALALFGCMRLGARVWELREAGHAITRRMVEVPTRAGRARVAEYFLTREGE